MKVWSSSFNGGAAAASCARHAVREALSGELPERKLDDVELLVSELATNSIRHAGCDEGAEISMEADVRDDCIRLRLCDEGAGFDHVEPQADLSRGGGFGLMLVDKLADRWGVARNDGFCVWFEVQRA
jgi:anti-sigma regulatory factor (Ser/Thr protein kinase)